jgi:hypothetical protein
VGAWNPYSQQSQLLGGALSMLNSQRPTGQEHPFSVLNPALVTPVEAVTNRDMYTDYPLSGNVFKNLLGSTKANIPLLEFLHDVVNPSEPSGRSVFMPSRKNAMLNFAGIPIRDVDQFNMSTRMQADENRRKRDGVMDYWKFHDGV